jgi:hypothetical protein
MKSLVKGIWIDSSSILLEEYLPENPKCFGLWIELRVGPSDLEGGHDYRILVCTPEWIEKEYSCQKAVWGRHMLIVFNYDLDQIKEKIYNYVTSCTGKDFWEIAIKVSRIAAWEFEDYQP